MTIRDLQRAIAEVGRIRIGAKASARGGGTRPSKLEQFRLTSPDQRLIHQAAALYGGTPRPWTPEGRPKQFEVYTESDALNVIVPPSDMALTQDYELWSAGGCQRRCDGAWEQLGDQPCLCDPLVEAGEPRLCKIHSRLWVMLADMPGLGLWRLETSGWYAARELLGSVDVIKLAAGRGAVLPARLLLEQRQIKRADETVKKFAVPRLDPQLTPNQLFAYADAPALEAPRTMASIEAPAPADVEDGSASFEGPKPEPRSAEPTPPARGPRPPDPRGITEEPEPEPAPKRKRGNVTPVPDNGGEPPSIREQVNSPSRYKRRTIDAPTSGLPPRTVAEVKGGPSADLGDEAQSWPPGDPGTTVEPPAPQRCSCEQPWMPGIHHRLDGPCFIKDDVGTDYRPASRFGDPTRKTGEVTDWPAPETGGVQTSDAGLTPDKTGERAGGTGMPAPASEPRYTGQDWPDDIDDAEHQPDDDPLPDEPPDDDPGPPIGRQKVTSPQLTKLAILRQAERYDDTPEGRAQWFAWLSAAVRRTVTTNKDLYKDEASEVIDLLEEAQTQDKRRGSKR